MYGRVTRFFYGRRYGFILGEDRKTYFVHQSKLGGEHLEPGYYVYFKPYATDRSHYNAENVIVIEADEW